MIVLFDKGERDDNFGSYKYVNLLRIVFSAQHHWAEPNY